MGKLLIDKQCLVTGFINHLSMNDSVQKQDGYKIPPLILVTLSFDLVTSNFNINILEFISDNMHTEIQKDMPNGLHFSGKVNVL